MDSRPDLLAASCIAASLTVSPMKRSATTGHPDLVLVVAPSAVGGPPDSWAAYFANGCLTGAATETAIGLGLGAITGGIGRVSGVVLATLITDREA